MPFAFDTDCFASVFCEEVIWRTSALAYRRGHRRGNHHASKVFPSSIFLHGVFVPRFLLYCLAASLQALLSAARRNGCRERDAPLGLFPLFASVLS